MPAYNDGPSLTRLLERAFATLRRVTDDYEVIVVNDGSTDNTASVLEDLAREYGPQLRVITHPQNRGYGGALQSGFRAASKEFVFYTDGDGQYDPAELVSLLDHVTPDIGMVNGFKTKRSDPWHRVAIGWLYNRFARTIFGIKIHDIDCDFRLIRRSVLEGCELRSTSGTICVELVRSIELSGVSVVEVPVHHYPRLHGRSQFFRVKSLASTFFQLCALFARLVAFQGPNRFYQIAGLVFLSICGLSMLAYLRSITLPFISDDYLQIQLAREYGPISGWQALARDALYRCRATSLILTHWTEMAFGLSPAAFSISSLVLHVFNALLVFAMGLWRPIGWKLSAVAACFFAVSQRHHEAIIWYAAIPELLVFLFSLGSFLCWVYWLQSRTKPFGTYACAFFLFLAALLSKESAVAVVPLLALTILCERQSRWSLLGAVAPFAVTAGMYFSLGLLARDTHLHYNDGTFSLSAPFLATLSRSTIQLLGIWGKLAIAALLFWKVRERRPIVAIGAAWMAITLLPYSFLTYMSSVPSRHTYLASAGLALIVAAGLVTLYERCAKANRRWLAFGVAGVMVSHQCLYLWTKKHYQFSMRAAPTETLVDAASRSVGPLYVKCFPYDRAVADLALRQRIDRSPALIFGPDAAGRTDALDLCNAVVYLPHF